MDLEKIRMLSERYNGGLKRLAYDIGMSEANLHRCINKNKIQASDLEKIANCLGVDVVTFFDLSNKNVGQKTVTSNDYSAVPVHGDTAVTMSNVATAVLEERIRSLQEQLKSQRQLLEEKERTIKILMSK